MKLRTSFFNIHVLKKNLIRFAPVWVLYSVAAILYVLMMGGGNARVVASSLITSIGLMAVYRCIHAFIVAACLFGDLFDSRICNGLHAMPMRRGGWLWSNLISGFLFALIPALAGGGVATIFLGEYAWVAVVWQGANLLFFLFFFAVAVFSAMCAGKRLGMMAIYAILNTASVLIYWVINTIYQPLLYGVVFPTEWFVKLCPVVNMVANEYVQIEYPRTASFAVETWVWDDWNYLAICAGIGIVLYALSFLLYRNRKLETAGDFLSFKTVRFIFMLAYTLAVGTLIFVFGNTFQTEAGYGFLAVGVIIGYFTGRMLLDRTVKVFYRKSLLVFAIVAALLAGSIGLTVWDPMGVQSYIPPTEEIACASLYPEGNRHYSEEYVDMNYSGWYITDPEEIDQMRNLHGRILQETNATNLTTVNVQYQLENGIRMERCYEIPNASTEAKEISAFLIDLRSGVGERDWDIVAENIQAVFVYGENGNQDYTIKNTQQQKALLEALSLDAQAGTMLQTIQAQYLRRNDVLVAKLHVMWEVPNRDRESFSETINVYEDCTHTISWLKTLGLI